jgi:hypothetical protein
VSVPTDDTESTLVAHRFQPDLVLARWQFQKEMGNLGQEQTDLQSEGRQARRAILGLGSRFMLIPARGRPRCHGRVVAANAGLLAVVITDVIQRLVFIYPVSHPGRRAERGRRRGSSVCRSVADQCGIDLA